VPTSRAELTSIATQLRELTGRVVAAGEELDTGDTEGAAMALFDVERALRAAGRALDRARDQLR
jgi:hypothetical protein